MSPVVIGVDGGTTAVKAVAFDLDGSVRCLAHRGVKVEYGSHGEAEQDMNAIWEAVADCLQEVTAQLVADDIIGVGLTGQGDGAWLLDEDRQPVRKAATWLDGRAGERVATWQADGRAAKVLAVTGTTIFPGLAPILLDEFTTSEPDALARARHLVYCKDWLRSRLTGEVATDYTEASRNFLDVRTATGFDPDLPGELGLAEAAAWLPPIRRADEQGGTVTAAAAERTGLPEGTPVAVGMIDVAVTGVGLGALDDGAAWLILGTTGFVGTLLGSVQERHSDESMVLATGRGRQVMEFFAPMTGTPNLDWIRATLGFAEQSWAEVETLARSAEPGSGGVVYLPYASPGGERAPFNDPNASASWLGLSVTTTPAEILRSVYEGVAYSLAECIQVLGIEQDLIVSGGGFRSDLVCQILADITGKRVTRQDAPEAGARGAAVLALTAAGYEPDSHKAAKMLATSMSSFEPDPELRDVYALAHRVYRDSRDALRPQWKAMRELRSVSHEHAKEA